MTSIGDPAGRFFTAHQRETIEAAMARIIPTDERPGAREAGAIEFLDRYLSGLDFIIALPDGSGFETLTGKRAEAWRRRIEIVRATYVTGIENLDLLGQAYAGADFARLTAAQQDHILSAMERSAEMGLGATPPTADGAATLGAPAGPALQQTSVETEMDFFPLLCLHTRQGFYADALYGGNKDHAGWQVIGFPGPTSLAETHAGRYTTLPYFAEGESAHGEEDGRGV